MSNYHIAYSIALVAASALTLGVVLLGVALGEALAVDPNLIRPSADQEEQVKLHPVGPGEFVPDLAWPFYPFRQSQADLEETRANLAELTGALWRRPVKAFFHDGIGWWVLFPIPVAVLSFLLVVGLASWFCFFVYALVNVIVSVASLALVVPLAAALRIAERVRRDRRLSQAACMRCFHVTPWPAYQCPTCRRPHQDVRPGRLGLLVRRCDCGAHLPMLASRAAWRVTAVCKRCGAPLPEGAGGARDVRVPVFGDVSAGKTRYLYASLNSLMQTAQAAGLDVSFPDDGSREQAEFGLDVIRSSRETAKTSTNTQITLTCRLGTGHRSELIHLFDAAGEHFRSARQPDTLRFLDDSQGLVYVLDPFSVEPIRQRLDAMGATSVDLAHAAAGDPELTYEDVLSRLRDSGIPASTQLLAVIVSKADLLRSAGLEPPAGSEAIARWLRDDCGVHNLVISASREFAEVRYFMVASQDVAPGGQDDPGTPLRWLLTSHGVRLPADASESGNSAGSSGRVNPVRWDRRRSKPAPREPVETPS